MKAASPRRSIRRALFAGALLGACGAIPLLACTGSIGGSSGTGNGSGNTGSGGSTGHPTTQGASTGTTGTGTTGAGGSVGGPQGPLDPGRVSLRRMNRAEYCNTVRDLLGTAQRPCDQFPEDNVMYGFDTISSVQ